MLEEENEQPCQELEITDYDQEMIKSLAIDAAHTSDTNGWSLFRYKRDFLLCLHLPMYKNKPVVELKTIKDVLNFFKQETR